MLGVISSAKMKQLFSVDEVLAAVLQSPEGKEMSSRTNTGIVGGVGGGFTWIWTRWVFQLKWGHGEGGGLKRFCSMFQSQLWPQGPHVHSLISSAHPEEHQPAVDWRDVDEEELWAFIGFLGWTLEEGARHILHTTAKVLMWSTHGNDLQLLLHWLNSVTDTHKLFDVLCFWQ